MGLGFAVMVLGLALSIVFCVAFGIWLFVLIFAIGGLELLVEWALHRKTAKTKMEIECVRETINERIAVADEEERRIWAEFNEELSDNQHICGIEKNDEVSIVVNIVTDVDLDEIPPMNLKENLVAVASYVVVGVVLFGIMYFLMDVPGADIAMEMLK